MLVRKLINVGKGLARPEWRLVPVRMASAAGVTKVPPSDPFHGYPPGKQPATMDDMPVPHGSWQESYDQYQKKYNRQLGIGLSLLLGTLAYVYYGQPIDWVMPPPMKNPD